MKVGFIGLGHMGEPMARNLLKAGYEVVVFDLAEAPMRALVADGAFAAASIAELAQQVEIAITMLQTDQQVNSVCLGEAGLLAHLAEGSAYLDCSTISVQAARALHEAARARGVAMLDAPVSGGVSGASAGTLTFMVGGDSSDVARVKSLLAVMGKNIIHAGSDGTGQAAKACNNMILAISMVAVSEGFNLAEALGLEAKTFFEIASTASGQCWAMTSYCPAPGMVESAPSNRDYEAGFTANMMLKDLKLSQQAAESVGESTPMGALAAGLYQRFVDQGSGELDFSGIIRMLRQMAAGG
jgi:3-hydroxyisobutyrate dehydrogenase